MSMHLRLISIITIRIAAPPGHMQMASGDSHDEIFAHADKGGCVACRYKNIDKLIHYANKEGRINVFYSTPAAYTAAKHSYNQSWALKTDDFFPYADNPYSYWTGGPASLRSSQLTPFLLCKWWLPCRTGC